MTFTFVKPRTIGNKAARRLKLIEFQLAGGDCVAAGKRFGVTPQYAHVVMRRAGYRKVWTKVREAK